MLFIFSAHMYTPHLPPPLLPSSPLLILLPPTPTPAPLSPSPFSPLPSSSINPDYHDALMSLATLLADQGRLEEGWHYMQRAAAVATDNADVYNNLAAYLLRMGRNIITSFFPPPPPSPL